MVGLAEKVGRPTYSSTCQCSSIVATTMHDDLAIAAIAGASLGVMPLRAMNTLLSDSVDLSHHRVGFRFTELQ